MAFHIAATFTAIVHLAFIAFVVTGGLLVLRRRWLMWAHLPAAVWGVLVEFGGWYCPLTEWENYFLRRAGEAGYEQGFVAHYVFALIYPVILTRSLEIALGALVLLLNGAIYAYVFRTRRGRPVPHYRFLRK